MIISKLLLCCNTPQVEGGMHVCAFINDALAHDWLGAAIFAGLQITDLLSICKSVGIDDIAADS